MNRKQLTLIGLLLAFAGLLLSFAGVIDLLTTNKLSSSKEVLYYYLVALLNGASIGHLLNKI